MALLLATPSRKDRGTGFLSPELQNLGFHIATKDGGLFVGMRFMICSAPTKGKASAFRVIRNTHILFRSILRKRGLADNTDAIAIKCFIQFLIRMRIGHYIATALLGRLRSVLKG